MKNLKRSDKNLYFKLIDILSEHPKSRRMIIDEYIRSLALSREELLDRSTGGRVNINRSIAGSAIDEMHRKGIISKDSDGLYSAAEQKPVVIRIEKCEALLLKLLAKGPMSKHAIRSAMISEFGTDKTLTERDDNKLFTILSDILRRLTREGIIEYHDKIYSLPTRVEAKIDDIEGVLQLKESFLSRLHKRGGEFFEIYFMSLLERFVTKHGKRVISNTTTGGASDGGIDGIMLTEDCLGFRETTMVQTKNRESTTNETDVRGFYGALCAKAGSRGIFATSGDFHYAARQFLNALDNCVGVNGDTIFKMAIETSYGIKKSQGKLSVDDKVI